MPEAYINHITNNRLRLKIPNRKRNLQFLETVKEGLLKHDNIVHVDVNPITASALVVFNSNITTDSLDEFVKYCADSDIVDITLGKDKNTRVNHWFYDRFSAVNRKVSVLSSGDTNLSDLFYVGLIMTGVYQIFRGNIGLPAWYTAFWYAFGIFGKSRK
ncbi:hypothetical protein MCHI_000287 [Candidatus Magnetoovum chiemensis]|nr:hypothetical protein MCHI_000287 [Candidatus Magnetoovum chiemensis]